MDKLTEIPVVWFQAAACSGCVTSTLNSLSPTIKNFLVDNLAPGKHVSLKFMTTVMASSGEPAVKVLINTQKTEKGKYVLILEGAIQKKDFAEFMGKPAVNVVEELAKNAALVAAMGTCASFGGIPKGSPNPTGCQSVKEFFESKGIKTPFINIPGCPPHPDWFVGTISAFLNYGLPKLDTLNRPVLFYGKLIHETCERRPYFDKGKFARVFGEEGCLYELGCKGPFTNADCSIRSWNSGVNWCIQNGSPCIGCCEPEFIDFFSPLYKKTKAVPSI